MYLNRKSVLCPCVAEIVWNHVEDNEEKLNKMRQKFINNRKFFSFFYSYFYPEIYSFVDKRSIDLRNEFHIKFKEWKVKLISQKIMNNLKWLRQRLHHHHLHQVQYRKNLLSESSFENEWKIAEKQKQLWRKKLGREREEKKLQIKTKNSDE